MGKHDMPSLQFTVEGGRLIPAGPYEAEVLGSYSRGAQLTVTLHQKRSLPLLKKYWAVLRDVVDNCKTPWNSSEEASDAIKLALGVTDIGKTVKGQWFIRPGSISFNSMDQAAFRDYFEKAMAILASVTGISPDDLARRYSHISEQDQHSSAAPSADEKGSGASPADAAPDLSPSEPNSDDETGELALEAAGGQSAAGSPVDNQSQAIRFVMEECIDNMLRDAFSEPKDQQSEKVEKLRAVFLEPQNLGGYPDFVNRCADTILRIVGKPDEKERAREYLIGRMA